MIDREELTKIGYKMALQALANQLLSDLRNCIPLVFTGPSFSKICGIIAELKEIQEELE